MEMYLKEPHLIEMSPKGATSIGEKSRRERG